MYAAGVLSQTRHYYQNDQNQVLEERVDSSSNPNRQYTWGSRYIDDLVLRTRDTDSNGSLDETLYALHDANWSITALTDTSGTVLERFRYDAYGKPLVLDANFAADADGVSDYAWEYRFTSREWDAESRLHYFRARYYDDAGGRFLQRDPIGYADGMNLYAGYFATGEVDPNGTQSTIAPAVEPLPNVWRPNPGVEPLPNVWRPNPGIGAGAGAAAGGSWVGALGPGIAIGVPFGLCIDYFTNAPLQRLYRPFFDWCWGYNDPRFGPNPDWVIQPHPVPQPQPQPQPGPVPNCDKTADDCDNEYKWCNQAAQDDYDECIANARKDPDEILICESAKNLRRLECLDGFYDCLGRIGD